VYFVLILSDYKRRDLDIEYLDLTGIINELLIQRLEQNCHLIETDVEVSTAIVTLLEGTNHNP
jgi:hypothetical protein